MDTKLLERVQKLLAKSESDNPHEAKIFLAKAQQLMAEFDDLRVMVSGTAVALNIRALIEEPSNDAE